MTKIGTTYLTIAGDVLAPAMAIAEYANGDIFAVVETETATVRCRLVPAKTTERSSLKSGEYVHPAAMIDNVTAPTSAASRFAALASSELEAAHASADRRERELDERGYGGKL
jgi:hypothetical protein